MRLHRAVLILGTLVFGACGIIGWSLLQQTAPTRALDQIMPEGPLLYIESRDFSALLKDWNGSAAHAKWLKSDDYRVFSNSRLFLRLGEASDQFAVAAGLPPDMKFLVDAAGKESALGVFDIGNLELLYITRLPSGEFLESALWQSRNKFQPRTAAGKPFYTRKDEKSGRVVAFAVADDYLILGTREDLVAGSLELMSGSKGRNLRQEGWFAQALASTSATSGDLRMVMNIEKLAVTPHFRTYWIQRNITEMQSYNIAISDLYREGALYREERVMLPRKQLDENALTERAQLVSSLLAWVPNDYGFYQARPANAAESLSVLQQKILTPQFTVEKVDPEAPKVQLTGGDTGAKSDLETGIDTEPAAYNSGVNGAQALRQQIEKANPQGILSVQRTRKDSGNVMLSIPTVVVIAGAGDWNVSALQKATQDVMAPAMTAATLGLQWHEIKDAGGYYELDGLNAVQMAIRGRTVYFANDADLLVSVLQSKGQLPVQPAIYAAGFSHSRERENFYKLSSLLDQGARASDPQPQFFSRNISSFSQSFATLESEEVITRQIKDKIQQTVTYRWTP